LFRADEAEAERLANIDASSIMRASFLRLLGFFNLCVPRTPHVPKEKEEMPRLTLLVLSLILLCGTAAVAQNSNSSTTAKNTNASAKNQNGSTTKRGPIFRATADQVKQAQAILK
jgi:hypothetical protein